MHSPGAYFFVLKNPKGGRAQNHGRKKQNFGIEPDDTQGIGNKYSQTNEKPRPGFTKKNGDCKDSIFFVALDVFEIFYGERNRKGDDEKPKNLDWKLRNVLIISQKHETA